MPRRSPPPAEEAPFVPAEPWWRQPRPGQGGKRSATAQSPRFESAAPRLVEPTATLNSGRMRIAGATVAAIGAALALLAGIIALVTTDWLAVARVSTEIRGAQRIPADAIYAASQMDGVNIFQVHPGRVAARLKKLPGIAEATVHPRLPYYVTITVREEVPFVVWQGVTTTLWLAENGAIVPANGAPPPLKLVDPAGAAAQPSDGRLRDQVLADLKALQAAGLEAAELYYGVQEGLYFRAGDGWTVYLGHGGMAAKLTALEEIRRSSLAAASRSRIIDLRVSGRAQIR